MGTAVPAAGLESGPDDPEPVPVARLAVQAQAQDILRAGGTARVRIQVSSAQQSTRDVRLKVVVSPQRMAEVSCVKDGKGACRLGDVGSRAVTVMVTLRAPKAKPPRSLTLTATATAADAESAAERITVRVKPQGRPKPKPSPTKKSPPNPGPSPTSSPSAPTPQAPSPSSLPSANVPLPQIAAAPTPVASVSPMPTTVLRAAGTPGPAVANLLVFGHTAWLAALLAAFWAVQNKRQRTLLGRARGAHMRRRWGG